MASNAKSSFLSPTANTWYQLIRYGISGGLATIIDMTILWAITSVLGWHYQIGVGCGYLVGLIITYLMATLWIFNEHRTDKKWLEFLGFTVIGLIGLGCTHILMWLLVDCWMGKDYYMIAKIITVAIVSILNFILKKHILFTK